MYIPTEVRAALNGLILQARSQWNPRQPLDHAYVKARFLVKDGRQDLDNKLTCILDVLVEAGVLINDSIAHLAGFEASAVLVGRKMDERTEIDVWRDLGWKAIS